MTYLYCQEFSASNIANTPVLKIPQNVLVSLFQYCPVIFGITMYNTSVSQILAGPAFLVKNMYTCSILHQQSHEMAIRCAQKPNKQLTQNIFTEVLTLLGLSASIHKYRESIIFSQLLFFGHSWYNLQKSGKCYNIIVKSHTTYQV